MRKIREVLRLKWVLGCTHREVRRACRVSHGTVSEYLKRARGLTWEVVSGLDDGELERRLYPPPAPSHVPRPMPEWAEVYQEHRKPGVTRWLLWEEYRADHPDGYGYSQFCEHYRRFTKRLHVTLRRDYKAGEVLEVDWAGQKIPIHDRKSGEVHEASLFVACLGASHYTFARATWDETLPQWIDSHVRAFEFLGGVPEMIVPDNPKTAVTSPCYYEPDLNRTYAEMADHYGVAVVPARVLKPRDKAKVESAVLQTERWILARLRNRTFFSLAEVNAAIGELLVRLNDRRMRELDASRRELFHKLDRPALGPLPQERYRFAAWKKVRVGCDYHVAYEKHYYSVPYQLVSSELDLRATAHCVEVFHKGKSVAVHVRARGPGHTTLPQHMPKSHQEIVGWTPRKLLEKARGTGKATRTVVETILATRRHPQQGFRSCLGLMRLEKRYGGERLELACDRALRIASPSYKSVQSILKAGLDRQPVESEHPPAPTAGLAHENLRGEDYYQQGAPS
ncbi:MAG: IS21 family transposase [Acidimicrobiia bacterium]|nr:IS21 family transposase [Acidimicrobiia bacterium]